MKKLAVVALFAALFVMPFELVADEEVVINSIEVTGNKRVETATVKAFLNLPTGRQISQNEIDEAFRKTYDTGLFKDLKLQVMGDVLRVYVEENPTVGEVVVKGNDKIEGEKIKAELKVKSRSVYKESDVQADVKRIMTLYQRSGRFDVRVKTETDELENNRIKVVYDIYEGSRAKVSQISFINNYAYDEAELESIVSTKESRWYRFFSSSDNYDPDRVDYDQELLRQHYVSNGYADFSVTSADAEFNPNTKSFNIIFTLDEGQYYNFGKIDVSSEIPDIKYADIKDSIRTEKGEEFNAEEVKNTVSELTDILGDKGYAFVQINPKYKKNKEQQRVDVTYDISEGPRVYINRINISGNTRTKDEVIRREFRIAEGDPFNSSKIKRSKQRIQNLGFFKEVEVENEQTDAADKVDLDVTVEEQSTGELTFGAGFSSTEGALGDVSISERNLLGRGQFLRLNFTLASARQEIDLSFTEPYFLGRNFSAGFDVFNIVTDSETSSSNLAFDSETTGATIRGSYPLSEYIKHSLRYTYRNDDISNPDPNATLFVRQQVGERATSLVGHTFSYDTLDNRFFPKDGVFASLSQEFAGLGGDVEYLKHEAKVSFFTVIDQDLPDWVLKLAAKGGNITGIGDDDVRINDRFFIGGSTLRGFDNQGIGARDKNTQDPLGGNNYATTTAEIMFPLGLPEELQIKGSAFTEAGTLYEVDDTDPTLQIQDESSIRASAGVGVFWRSPVGPIRIDFANAILKEDFDETESIRFSFGTRF